MVVVVDGFVAVVLVAVVALIILVAPIMLVVVVAPMALKFCWRHLVVCGGMSPMAVIGQRSAVRFRAMPQNCAAEQEA